MARIVYSTATRNWTICQECGEYFQGSGFDDGLPALCADCQGSYERDMIAALDDCADLQIDLHRMKGHPT